jgi:hypothetical protein
LWGDLAFFDSSLSFELHTPACLETHLPVPLTAFLLNVFFSGKHNYTFCHTGCLFPLTCTADYITMLKAAVLEIPRIDAGTKARTGANLARALCGLDRLQEAEAAVDKAMEDATVGNAGPLITSLVITTAAMCKEQGADVVRCALFDSDLNSRMPLGPTLPHLLG